MRCRIFLSFFNLLCIYMNVLPFQSLALCVIEMNAVPCSNSIILFYVTSLGLTITRGRIFVLFFQSFVHKRECYSSSLFGLMYHRDECSSLQQLYLLILCLAKGNLKVAPWFYEFKLHSQGRSTIRQLAVQVLWHDTNANSCLFQEFGTNMDWLR